MPLSSAGKYAFQNDLALKGVFFVGQFGFTLQKRFKRV